MPERLVIYADPFLKKEVYSGSIPENAVHICTYEMSVGIDEVDESAYFIQRNGNDELWLRAEFGKGCGLILSGNGAADTACQELLTTLIKSRVGFCWPRKLIFTGTMTKETFDKMIRSIENELEANTKFAEKNKPEIAYVAEELGFYTRPDGKIENHWRATCPGINHYLQLQSTENVFFCGYCKRCGGIDELRSFVKEREES